MRASVHCCYNRGWHSKPAQMLWTSTSCPAAPPSTVLCKWHCLGEVTWDLIWAKKVFYGRQQDLPESVTQGKVEDPQKEIGQGETQVRCKLRSFPREKKCFLGKEWKTVAWRDNVEKQAVTWAGRRWLLGNATPGCLSWGTQFTLWSCSFCPYLLTRKGNSLLFSVHLLKDTSVSFKFSLFNPIEWSHIPSLPSCQRPVWSKVPANTGGQVSLRAWPQGQYTGAHHGPWFSHTPEEFHSMQAKRGF